MSNFLLLSKVFRFEPISVNICCESSIESHLYLPCQSYLTTHNLQTQAWLSKTEKLQAASIRRSLPNNLWSLNDHQYSILEDDPPGILYDKVLTIKIFIRNWNCFDLCF